MLATIDAMMSLRESKDEQRADLALLIECARTRAARRGCVEIDCALASEEARRTLIDNGFAAGPEVLGRSLRREEDAG